MPILIEKVRIQNFRSLKSVEVTLSTLTLLVGANNAGKTSFLKALNLALGVERRNVTKDDLFIDKNGERLKDIEGKENRTIIIDVKIISVDNNGVRVEEFDEDWTSEFQTSNTTEQPQEFFAFRTKFQFKSDREDAKLERFEIKGDWNNPIINESSDLLTARLDKMPLYFVDAQRDIMDDLKNRTSYFGRLATQIEYEPTEKANLENQLQTINEAAVRDSKVMSHVKTNLENLNTTLRAGGSGVEITPFAKKLRDLHKSIKIHYQDADSDTFELDYHGMGTRSWASLLAFKAYVSWENSIENPKPQDPFHPLLALEEPEAHLHPNAQRQLYKQLKEINGQKIISTHSPYVVGLAELDEIRYFCRENEETVVKNIDISAFTPNEKRKAKREILHSKGELLFSKIVVLCEGETEEQLLPMLAIEHFDVEPFELGVNFVGCGGSNYAMFIRIFKALNIKWIIFSDYDTVETKNYVNSALTTNGLILLDAQSDNKIILLEKDIEQYLVDESYIDELKEACYKFIANFYSREQMRAEKQAFIDDNSNNNENLVKFLKNNKTKLAPYYAEEIANITDETRRTPPKIKELFEAIEAKLL